LILIVYFLNKKYILNHHNINHHHLLILIYIFDILSQSSHIYIIKIGVLECDSSNSSKFISPFDVKRYLIYLFSNDRLVEIWLMVDVDDEMVDEIMFLPF